MMDLSPDIGVWIAALLTLGMFSFLYGDNLLYKVCESLFIGVSAGYLFTVYFLRVVHPKLLVGLFVEHRWDYLVPAALSLAMLFRLTPRWGWVARYALSFVIGINAGLILVNVLKENLLNQIAGTIVPLLVFEGEGAARTLSLAQSVNNVVMVLGVASALVYFFFSSEHKGFTGKTARLGAGFLMVSFGAAFGYTIMARLSLLIGRLHFLLADWLGVLQ